MTAQLRFNPIPITQIRHYATHYPRHHAHVMYTAIQTGFTPQSPAPSGAPPARRSGGLARSIGVHQRGAYRWDVVAGAQYARYLEFGTRKMAARPFFLRAFAESLKHPPSL